jgi:hypothetical protein
LRWYTAVIVKIEGTEKFEKISGNLMRRNTIAARRTTSAIMRSPAITGDTASSPFGETHVNYPAYPEICSK